jgi:hypothetical protein
MPARFVSIDHDTPMLLPPDLRLGPGGSPGPFRDGSCRPGLAPSGARRLEREDRDTPACRPRAHPRSLSAAECLGPRHHLRSRQMAGAGALSRRRSFGNRQQSGGERHPAHGCGQQNCLFVGAADTGQRGAILYTIVEKSRRRGIDPSAYLRDVLTRLPKMLIIEVASITPEV